MDMSQGLTIYQQRLLECARIVREGKFEHSSGFSMRRFPTCVLGEYWRAHPEASQTTPENFDASRFHDAMLAHFGAVGPIAKGIMSNELFAHHLSSNRNEAADRIEKFVYLHLTESHFSEAAS